MAINQSVNSEPIPIKALSATNPQLIIVTTKRRCPPELRNSHK